jgi:hypothetical protein
MSFYKQRFKLVYTHFVKLNYCFKARLLFYFKWIFAFTFSIMDCQP